MKGEGEVLRTKSPLLSPIVHGTQLLVLKLPPKSLSQDVGPVLLFILNFP